MDTYADGARPRVECLWLNPLAQAQLKRDQAQGEIDFTDQRQRAAVGLASRADLTANER